MDEGTTATLASPPLDHIIERPRLISLLEESGARIILLCAPAGYGKTTLARQWSARQHGPVAWYRTTRASGDVAALAVGLDKVLAATTHPPNRDPTRISSIAASGIRPAPLARALVSTYAHLTPETLLVVDDWESAGTPESEELLGTVIDALHTRVLVTSRTRPTWFGSRLVVYGEGLELGLDQLAMTEIEAFNVLATDRRDRDRQSLLERSRGWPAVLGLAAMSARTEMPSDEVSRTLQDFLAAELLATTPKEVTDGLIALVAASVSELSTVRLLLDDQTDAVLAEATSRGLVTLDTDHTVSLHPLVRETLALRLHSGAPLPDATLINRLTRLVDARMWDEALAASEALKHQEFVTKALRAGLDDLLSLRGATTLDRWVAAGRAAHVDRTLVSYVESESAVRSGKWDRALMLASRAAPHLSGDLAARAHLVAAMAGHFGDRAAAADRHVSAGLDLAERRDTRRAAHWLRFVRALDDERDVASDALHAFEQEAPDNAETIVRVAQGRLHLALLLGDVVSELDRAETIVELLDQDVTPLARTAFLNMYSHSLSAVGRYGDALRIADEEAVLAEEYELDFVRHPALVNRARALIGLRRFALAQRALSQLRRLDQADPKPYALALHSIQVAGLHLSTGDARRAYAALALDPGRTGSTFRAEYLALRALAQTTFDEDAALQSADVAAKTSRGNEVQALVSVVRASVAANRGDVLEATSHEDTALHTGISHAFVLGLRTSIRLVEHIASRSELIPMLASLLHETRDSALARRLGANIPRSQVRTQVLSPREAEIHGLIAQGMTNLEIARLLFISESTAKVHVRHIFEKLGVRSRAEAVSVWQDAESSE